MAHVTDRAAAEESSGAGRSVAAVDHPFVTLASIVLVGGVLAGGARISAVALLVGVAAVQALVTLSWTIGTAVPGRNGTVLVGAMAAAGADVAVWVWPGGQLGTLLPVFGLAVPVMFVVQLMRAAARVRVVESLAGVTFLIFVVVSPAAYLQLRHEFTAAHIGGTVVSGVVLATAGALLVGLLVDLVMPAPRFDPAADRGLLAVVASAGLGGSIGHLALGSNAGFLAGRGAFVGAACGALAGLLAVAIAFVRVSAPEPESAAGRGLRSVLPAVVPLSLVAPVGFLLCLAVRA
ncbi:MAG: hypothetical protein QOE97_3593 [Pseudonocardiales bacterium]|jgi:hypothetical protein|nr:hypothetical protein [Pseudonocardiales bacterium]